MTYVDEYSFCNRYLLSDEYILWKGRPEKGNILSGRNIFMAVFAIMWLSFSVFWELAAISTMNTTGSFFVVIWGLPFIGVGIYLLFEALFGTAYYRNKTFYVITNKKIIIKRGKKITMKDGSDLPPMEIEIHRNGNGTIIFSEEVYTRKGRRQSIYFMLENIADVAGAQEAVSQMEHQEGQRKWQER